MTKNILSVFACLQFVFAHSNLFAYDDKNVHPAINKSAAYLSAIDSVLNSQLGFHDGIESKFSLGTEEKKVWEWLRQGGTDEDKPDPRVLRHFHDPIYPASQWNSAGFGAFDSSLVWAQEPSQSIFGGDHSWVAARDSFYSALTTGSEEDYGDTFLALGQVMHLVSDMAVPAHVRADSHLTYLPWSRDVYEAYTKLHFDMITTMTPYTVDQAIFARAKASTFAATPISALWDQDACNNSSDPGQVNCDPDALWFQAAGLAEYTNANFLSRDTFDDYTYPAAGTLLDTRVNWHDRTPVEAEDRIIDYPAYVERILPNGTSYRLAGMNYFAMDLGDGGVMTGYDLTLDDEVNKGYANILIPRAIGYSTALLDYFFRGDIDLKPGSAGGYSLVNNTSENMTGTFAVYYDDTIGTRRKLVEWTNKTVTAIGRTEVGNVAMPTDVGNPAKYYLVFKGKMGREDGAIAGRIVSLKPQKDYALIVMSTSFVYSSVIPKEETPDIAILWDMETDSIAKITDTAGRQISFPISYQELLARTDNLSNYQLANSEKLLTVGSYSGDPVPDCLLRDPANYEQVLENGDDGTCSKWSHQGYDGFRSCENASNFTGGNNTVYIHESADTSAYKLIESEINVYNQEHCTDIVYGTSTSSYVNEETVSVTSAGDNTKISLPYLSGSSIFPNSQQIFILNNDSGAENKLSNNAIVFNDNSTRREERAGQSTDSCGVSWTVTVSQRNINARINNNFFGWEFDLSANYSNNYTRNNYEYWPVDSDCGTDYHNWSPKPEIFGFKLSLTSLSNSVSGAGIQSTYDNLSQFQIGIIYSSIREIGLTINSGNHLAGSTYGPTKNYIKAFSSRWPKKNNNVDKYARNVNPWTLPRNSPLEGAVEEMTRYFANNFGEDPAQVRPDFFAELPLGGWLTPLAIAQQNLWKRKFDIQYLTASSF